MWPDPRWFWWRCPLSPCHWPSSWEPLPNMRAFFRVRVTHGKFTWFCFLRQSSHFPHLHSVCSAVVLCAGGHGPPVTAWDSSGLGNEVLVLRKGMMETQSRKCFVQTTKNLFLLFQLFSLFYLPLIPLQCYLFALPLSYLQAPKHGRRGCNWGSHDNLEHRKYSLSCFVSGFFLVRKSFNILRHETSFPVKKSRVSLSPGWYLLLWSSHSILFYGPGLEVQFGHLICFAGRWASGPPSWALWSGSPSLW